MFLMDCAYSIETKTIHGEKEFNSWHLNPTHCGSVVAALVWVSVHYIM
jgi:hypothetical protein